MIGQIITDADGLPLDNSGNKLSKSSYNPPDAVKKLFAKVQQDYQVAYMLQHRSFDEFDGVSLLDRARLDQELFGAFVGAQYLPQSKRWRWRGRKNTSRNKLIGILSRALAGMLYPFVYAKNEKNEEDKMTARVMRILIEDHLKKAGYKMKFLYMVLSALVNPAVIVDVEYLKVMQSIKDKKPNGEVEILQVVDELLSGLALNTVPIDEIMLPDFYSGTGKLQHLPCILRVQRIPYDLARNMYAGKHFYKGKDLFENVVAGTTRVVLTGQEGQTLYDIEWSEADRDYVQVITALYRSEDLEVTWVGGVGLFDYDDPYNKNPFKHRRMVLTEKGWKTIPVYRYAMSGFEPIDPAGRFAYYKSGAFKQYWDDQWLNKMDAFLYDGTALDIIKPMFLSGAAGINSSVMVPGAVVAMPANATATPYSIGPNLSAAYQAVQMAKNDLEDSTQSTPTPTTPTPDVTATQTNAAIQQAKVFFTCFSLMIADLVEQVGALTMDCVVQYSTIGELDATVPEALKMKYKEHLINGKDRGKTVTHKIRFSSDMIGSKITPQKKSKKEWELYNSSGETPKERYSSDQRLYLVNPYQFARTTYTMSVDADQIILKSVGADRAEKVLSFNMMTDERVQPYVDMKAVVDDFVIEEFGGDDPDRYRAKEDMVNGMLGAVMGNGTGAPPSRIKSPGGVVVPQVNPVA